MLCLLNLELTALPVCSRTQSPLASPHTTISLQLSSAVEAVEHEELVLASEAEACSRRFPRALSA